MKQQIKTTEAIFPMPVLLISTFNEDGSVDVMNAAWGTMLIFGHAIRIQMTTNPIQFILLHNCLLHAGVSGSLVLCKP